MAKRTVIEVTDDLDGSVLRDPRTIRFSVDGTHFELDTSKAHGREFDRAVAPYIAVARTVAPYPASTPRRQKLSAAQTRTSREQRAAIRSWARANGFTVSDRGVVPQEIVAAFDAAH